MEKYEKYKNSGIEWIGVIPENWSLKRLKYLLREKITDGPHETPEFVSDGIPFLSVDSIKDGEIIFENTRKISEVEHVRFQQKCKIERNDILMGKAASVGKIARVKVDFEFSIWSPLALLKAKTELITSEFLEYYLKSEYSQAEIILLSSFNTQRNISMADIPKLNIVLPRIEEQKLISLYLDQKLAELNKIIENKSKLISFYEEEKQAVINRAVIRGLNVNCELKRISEEWIGEIPKHWEIKKVKLICKIQGRIGFKGYKTSDLVFDGNGAITLGATHITKFNKIVLSEPVYLSWDKYYESPEIMVKEGDIVFTQRGAYLGKVGLIDKDYGDVTINPSLILLKNIKIHAPYLAYYLTSNYIRKSVDVISNSTAIPMISQEQLANFYCLIPPIEEQVEISKFIEEKNIASDRLIEKVKNQIELLQEYRATLISEVVTGKIKVPNTIEA
jgi:type I restriction enzyme S subunit